MAYTSTELIHDNINHYQRIAPPGIRINANTPSHDDPYGINTTVSYRFYLNGQEHGVSVSLSRNAGIDELHAAYEHLRQQRVEIERDHAQITAIRTMAEAQATFIAAGLSPIRETGSSTNTEPIVPVGKQRYLIAPTKEIGEQFKIIKGFNEKTIVISNIRELNLYLVWGHIKKSNRIYVRGPKFNNVELSLVPKVKEDFETLCYAIDRRLTGKHNPFMDDKVARFEERNRLEDHIYQKHLHGFVEPVMTIDPSSSYSYSRPEMQQYSTLVPREEDNED